jgi:hypothetical protein
MSVLRRFLAAVSCCGLVAAIVVYIASYMGSTMDDVFRWAIVLHLGIFLLLLSMYTAKYSAFRSGLFFWKEFGRRMPKWVFPTI